MLLRSQLPSTGPVQILSTLSSLQPLLSGPSVRRGKLPGCEATGCYCWPSPLAPDPARLHIVLGGICAEAARVLLAPGLAGYEARLQHAACSMHQWLITGVLYTVCD